MTNNAKKSANSFFKEYGLNTVSLENLKAIIQKQGYTIVEYNHIFNEEAVTKLLEALDLEDIAGRSKGFTYADSKRRLVFLHEDLSYEEKRMVLAHEEGHIYCNHLASVPILGRDVVEEHEANEFAHYILHRNFSIKANCILRNHKKGILITTCVLMLVAAVLFVYQIENREQRYFGEFYITATGNKYHEKDCIFIKHKDNVQRLTKEQFESGKYEPCEICLPPKAP